MSNRTVAVIATKDSNNVLEFKCYSIEKCSRLRHVENSFGPRSQRGKDLVIRKLTTISVDRVVAPWYFRSVK